MVFHTYRKKVEFHMTPDKNWLINEIDHVKTISSNFLTADEEYKKTFNWNITQHSKKKFIITTGPKLFC